MIKIHDSLEITYNKELDCLNVKNKNQNNNLYVKVDKDLPIIKEGEYMDINEYSGYARCVINDQNIYLHKLIMQDEIEKYKKEHPNQTKEPVIDHINRDRLDNRRCNLRVVTPRENSFNRGVMKHDKFIGVRPVHNKTKETTYRAFIRTPDGSTKTTIVYDNPEDAALAYDYYAKIYYPDSINTTNIELGKFKQEFLDERGIKSLDDIELPKGNLTKWSTKGNKYNYIGVSSDGHKGMLVKATDANGNRVNILHPNSNQMKKISLEELAAKREEWMIENNSTSTSNVIYPKPRKGMITPVGILAKKDERKEIEKQMNEIDKQLDEYEREKTKNASEEEVLTALNIKD